MKPRAEACCPTRIHHSPVVFVSAVSVFFVHTFYFFHFFFMHALSLLPWFSERYNFLRGLLGLWWQRAGTIH